MNIDFNLAEFILFVCIGIVIVCSYAWGNIRGHKEGLDKGKEIWQAGLDELREDVDKDLEEIRAKHEAFIRLHYKGEE